MISSRDLRSLFEAERPFIEQALELAEHFADVRKAQTEKGLDWARAKVLFKAMIQDERDGGHRVEELTRRADTTSEYATLMNNKNFSSGAEGRASPSRGAEGLSLRRGGASASISSKLAVVDAAAFSGTDSSLDGATRVRGNSPRFSSQSAAGPGREPAGAVVSTPSVSVGSLIEAAPPGVSGDGGGDAAMAVTVTHGHPDNLTIPEMLLRDSNNRAPWMERVSE